MAGSNWGEDWKRSNRKLVSTVRGSTAPKLAGYQSNGGESIPTLSIQEVQNAVNNGGNAAQTNVSGTPAAVPAATPADAAQNAALNVSGVGNAGRGLFYGTLGAGGKAADPTAFLAAAPGAYQSPYAAAMQQTMNGLLNPTPFKYDVNADGLYQQIKDNYIKQGRQAMMDTQGQSAALTGGYGNSYGAMAGQQAYQESLGNLAGMIPELQQIAWQQYQQGQDDQRNNLEAMNKLDAQEYARWADEQEKYQELLKTMPMLAQTATGGGGMSDSQMAGLINQQIANAMGSGTGNNKAIDIGQYQAWMALPEEQQKALAAAYFNGYNIGGTDKGTTSYMMENVFGPRYGYGVDTMTGAAPVVSAPAAGTGNTGSKKKVGFIENPLGAIAQWMGL